MSWELWLSLLLVCTLGAMSPGPSLAVVMRHTVGGGRRNGVIVALAHALGVAFYAGLTVLGLAAVVVHQPWLYRLVTWAGAAYLAWLGLRALQSGQGEAFDVRSVAVSGIRAARDGFAIALGNPKLIVFFIALLSQFVTPDMGAGAGWLVVTTAGGVDGTWYVLVALALSHSRVLPWLQRHAVGIQRVTGVVLLLLAARLVLG
ncbi:LysE family translocator [Salinicola halophilus]|uniref:LysE family translocator n=1 Tax=Salinicola halophilus TaxID=184065 RepID=UPI000DA1E5AE|nr:LysE family translocator [Salinicola halophilus]